MTFFDYNHAYLNSLAENQFAIMQLYEFAKKSNKKITGNEFHEFI